MPKSSIQEIGNRGKRIRTGTDRYPTGEGSSYELQYPNKKIRQPQALPKPPYSRKKTEYPN